MAGFLCILWILSNIFSPGDGIRIVTAMTPNGSLDPLKIHCETRKTVTASRVPEPSEGCILEIFTNNPSNIQQNPRKICSKKLQVGCVFLVDFLLCPKMLSFFNSWFTSLRVFRSWPRSSITSTFESWRVRSYTTSTSSNSSNSSSSSWSSDLG